MFEFFCIVMFPVLVGFYVARGLVRWGQNAFIDWQVRHDYTMSQRIERQLKERGVDQEIAKEAATFMPTMDRDMRDRVTYYLVNEHATFPHAENMAQGDIWKKVMNKTTLDESLDALMAFLKMFFIGALVALPFWVVYYGIRLVLFGHT